MFEEVGALDSARGIVLNLCQCAERFYGLVSESDDQEDENGSGDIESSIQQEMASIDKSKGQAKLFSPVHLDLPCVLFFKTRPPIDPVDFVHRICEEVVSTPGIRRMKYINRMTPVTLIGKATEKGLGELGKTILGQHFNLREDPEIVAGIDGNEDEEKSQTIASHSVSRSSIARSYFLLRRCINGIVRLVSRPNLERFDDEKLIMVLVRDSTHDSQSQYSQKRQCH